MSNSNLLTAAIDLGSNSFRLLIAEITATGLTPLVNDLETVRLAEKLADTGKLCPSAINRGLKTITFFSETLGRFPPMPLRICGTAALRLSKNNADFIQPAESIINQAIEIISADQEAEFAMHGSTLGLNLPERQTICLIDAGGGSTEVIFFTFTNHRTKASYKLSMPIGAVSLTEKFDNTSRTDRSDGLLAE